MDSMKIPREQQKADKIIYKPRPTISKKRLALK